MTLLKNNRWLRSRIYEYPKERMEEPASIVMTEVQFQDAESGYMLIEQCDPRDSTPHKKLFSTYDYMFAMYTVVRYEIGDLILDQCVWSQSQPSNRHDMFTVSFKELPQLLHFMTTFKEMITHSHSHLMAYLSRNNDYLFAMVQKELNVPILKSNIISSMNALLDLTINNDKFFPECSSYEEDD